MRQEIQKLLDMPLPLRAEFADLRANCFNAIQIYFGDTTEPKFVGPESFVSYMADKFTQINSSEAVNTEDVLIIWSRTSDDLPMGKINIQYLLEKKRGYPFGLVIEHAYVFTADGRAFQKRDPSAQGPYEILSEEIVLEPYLSKNGLEITRHRRC